MAGSSLKMHADRMSRMQQSPRPESADGTAEDYRRRTRELAALYASAGDLSSMRDVDQVLAAIVRRGRELLATDMAYLMLIDDERGDTFMRMTVGTQTPDFMSIRLAYGEGICGLVVETGAPQWTAHFSEDPRWALSVERIVNAEGVFAILAVPLMIGAEVIGVLCASDRRPRDFEHDEIALLASLADHAAIALVNARLFEDRERSLQELRKANERVERNNERLELAAHMHDRLTQLVATAASLDDLAQVVSDGLSGQVFILDNAGVPLTAMPANSQLDAMRRMISSDTLELDESSAGVWMRLARINTNARRLGYLIHVGDQLEPPDVRALERAAMVTALLLLDVRAQDEALGRAMAELMVELADPALGDELRVRDRAHTVGVRLADGPFVVLALIEADRRVGAALGVRLATMARSQRGLSGALAGQPLLVVPGKDALRAARSAADILTHDLGVPVTVGAAGPYPSLREAVARRAQAINCAKVLVLGNRVGQGATPGQLGFYTLLFSDVDRQQIEAFVEVAIGAVKAYDNAKDSDLLGTLVAYFDSGGQTGRIAETLHIHVNTLYQRLERLDQLLGDSWRRGEDSLQTHLALSLSRLLGNAV